MIRLCKIKFKDLNGHSSRSYNISKSNSTSKNFFFVNWNKKLIQTSTCYWQKKFCERSPPTLRSKAICSRCMYLLSNSAPIKGNEANTNVDSDRLKSNVYWHLPNDLDSVILSNWYRQNRFNSTINIFLKSEFHNQILSFSVYMAMHNKNQI